MILSFNYLLVVLSRVISPQLIFQQQALKLIGSKAMMVIILGGSTIESQEK